MLGDAGDARGRHELGDAGDDGEAGRHRARLRGCRHRDLSPRGHREGEAAVGKGGAREGGRRRPRPRPRRLDEAARGRRSSTRADIPLRSVPAAFFLRGDGPGLARRRPDLGRQRLGPARRRPELKAAAAGARADGRSWDLAVAVWERDRGERRESGRVEWLTGGARGRYCMSTPLSARPRGVSGRSKLEPNLRDKWVVHGQVVRLGSPAKSTFTFILFFYSRRHI
jgi:hypothetical protein